MDQPDLKAVVRETWERALDKDRTVSVTVVVDQVIKEHGDLVEEEASYLIRRALIRWVKTLARTEAGESSDLTLFGFPTVIAIPTEPDPEADPDDEPGDEYVYMRTAKAVWSEIESGEVIRVTNVRRAQDKLDQYRGAKEHVRPLMEGTGKTLAEALATA